MTISITDMAHCFSTKKCARTAAKQELYQQRPTQMGTGMAQQWLRWPYAAQRVLLQSIPGSAGSTMAAAAFCTTNQ